MKTTANIYLILFIIAGLLLTVGCVKGPKGEDGESIQGPQGNPGTNPVAPVVMTRPATADECVYGGVIVTINDSNASICNGAPGSTGTDGQNGQDGHDGLAGQDGADGQDGQNGSDGRDGVDGHDGSDAQTVEMVQFCPGEPSYPSTFPEYGIKLGTQIYGVYSTHGGFLTLLPPGLYSSNAVGSRCTFTINPDGSIN